MRLLFVHQNFPGQFKHLAPALASHPGNEVVALTMQQNVPAIWNRIRMVSYFTKKGSTPGVHPWLSDFESQVIRGEAIFRVALHLRRSGFSPDVIIAHPGWGESLFLQDVWPTAKLGIYCEFFYHAQGADIGFDPEFPVDEAGEASRLRMKNLTNMLHFESADAGISPTYWQASTFPKAFRDKITVVHDGIDCDVVAPNPAVSLTLNDGPTLTTRDEVITFANRNLEPYRGYHIFMRALPELLRRRPKAQVLIMGGDKVGYGGRPEGAQTWKDIFIREVSSQISAANWARVHFLGNIPYPHFISLLQLSTVHIYLTYPFVLSWSLLEAMSAGCAIVASDTQPLHEAIKHNDTGRLINFFDAQALTDQVCSLLEQPVERARLGRNARQFSRDNYDLKTLCLPKQLAWVTSLAKQ